MTPHVFAIVLFVSIFGDPPPTATVQTVSLETCEAARVKAAGWLRFHQSRIDGCREGRARAIAEDNFAIIDIDEDGRKIVVVIEADSAGMCRRLWRIIAVLVPRSAILTECGR